MTPEAVEPPRALKLLATVALLALAPLVAGAFEPLPRADPTTAGIDPAQLEQALDAMQQIRGARSVVVVRGGSLVAESHWYAPADALHPIWSVTKSVTSTLVGICVDRGILPDLDARIVDYLPPELIPADPAKDAITVRHLLMMTSGLRWSEDDDWLPWIASPNPARFILQRPLVAEPGAEFTYSSATSHIPSITLTEAAGVSLLELADAHLFGPLGITDRRWKADPQGYPFGGHGIELRTEDLAKLGVLFVNRGQWHGRKVVSAAWVEAAIRPRFGWGIDYGPLREVDYGYLWWTARAGGHDVFIGWGWGGQLAFCVPALDLVVATAADGDVWEAQADTQETAILEVIVEQILPAVSPLWREPRQPSGRVSISSSRARTDSSVPRRDRTSATSTVSTSTYCTLSTPGRKDATGCRASPAAVGSW